MEGGCCITKTLNAIIALCSSVSRMRASKTKIADRASAQGTSGATPFSLMSGRETRTKLPELSREPVDLNRQGVHERDWSSQLKGKAYAEEMRGTFSKSIELGDEVLLRAEKSNKLSSNFCPSLLEVIQKTGERLLSETAPGLKITNLVPEALFPRDEASAGIDEKEDKRADESNKETESHRPQESIRRSTCQDRRSP